MKKYAAYKQSGVKWLGDVPEDWAIKRLKFLVYSIKGGGTPATGNPDFWNGSIPWVSPKDMKVEHISRTKDYVTEVAISSSSTELVEANSILIVVRSGILKHTLPVALNIVPVSLNQDMKALTPTQEVMPEFLAVMLRGLQSEILAFCTKLQATVDSIEMDDLVNFDLPVPTLPEQRAIVAFLNERTAHLDGLIRRKEDLLKLLAEQRAALITRAVTQGLDASAPLQQSDVTWLEQVPAHWLITRLKFVADVHSGIAKGKKYLPTQELVEVPYLRVANVQDGYLNLDDITTISVTPAEAKSYELQPQDILMNEGGDNDKLGRGTVWEGQVAPCIHQNHVFAIRHNGKVDSWFLSYFFGSTACKPYFFLSGNQATNLASISSSAISDTPLALPPLAEQREIVAAINKGNKRLDKMTDITNREIAKLREYRAALITAAVTGRIDVRAAVPELAEA
jgi:type I restriction enzyme S subunit